MSTERKVRFVFATLTGRLPMPSAARAAGIRELLRLQADAGLEPLTAGRLPAVEGVVDAWLEASALTDRPVKQAIPGPYTLGRGVRTPADRADRTVAFAATLNARIRELADAGCPLVEVEEPGAVGIGEDEVERRLFVEAQRALLAGDPPIHRTLAIVGGSADRAGPETILDPPYHSYSFDLIGGPDNWRLVTAVPPERGVIVGVVDARPGFEEDLAILTWAAHYAAASGGRGLQRVGIANAGSLADLPLDELERKLSVLGEAARIAAGSSWEEVARDLDATAPLTAPGARRAPRPGVPRRRPGR